MPQGEDSKQREGSTVNYSTANIKGTYSPLLSSGDDCYKRLAVDPKSETVTKWFANADYIGGTESAVSLDKNEGD